MQQKSKADQKSFTTFLSDRIAVGKAAQHFVLIADHGGIDVAFKAVKEMIRQDPKSFLTLIYAVQWLFPTPLYQFELQLLERRFPARLMVLYAFDCDMISMGITEVDQQLLETVINANTGENMQFQIFGQEALVDSVYNRLHFLGIPPSQISLQIFK